MNWKTIENYPNYEISDCGMVLSHYSGNILKSQKHYIDGYLQVVLSKNGKLKNFTVHRLVAQAFIPNPENKREVDHIDRDPSNNHISNLRWVTSSENNQNKGYQCNNKLGIKNISYNKRDNIYQYEKTIEGTRVVKRFKTLDEAIQFKKSQH
jgi:hypothetical protein